MDIDASQPSDFIDLGDSDGDETLIISSDTEEDQEDTEWLEQVRQSTKFMKRELIRQACEQLAEDLINKIG